jgi:hypothetical protein
LDGAKDEKAQESDVINASAHVLDEGGLIGD